MANTTACVITLGNRCRTMIRESRNPADLRREHVVLALGDQDLGRA